MESPITSRKLGTLPDGTDVHAWTLRGSGGLVLETISYGATVTRLLVPDWNGRMADVVLGFDSLDAYLRSPTYMGAMIGRVAGRISNACLTLEGKRYQLAANDAPNHLHGGPCGFHAKVWTAVPRESSDGGVSLCLSCTSPDGEGGYPGTVKAEVTYTVTAENVFCIHTRITTNKTTPCSLTHHSYFNLGGDGSGSICDHTLSIASDFVVAVDEHMKLTAILEAVTFPGNDLREPRVLREVIPYLFRCHGDLYRLYDARDGSQPEGPRHVARLAHPATGRVLDIFTTENYLQLYTGCGLDGSLRGKSGMPYGQYHGLCLECEGYPDGANTPMLGDILVYPGKPREQLTAYAFSMEDSCSPQTTS